MAGCPMERFERLVAESASKLDGCIQVGKDTSLAEFHKADIRIVPAYESSTLASWQRS